MEIIRNSDLKKGGVTPVDFVKDARDIVADITFDATEEVTL